MNKIPENIENINFDAVVERDIGETLCPIVAITRKPDGTGLSQLYCGLVKSLAGSVKIRTVFYGQPNMAGEIEKNVSETFAATIVFCEVFYHEINYEEINLIKNKYKCKIALIFAWDSEVLDQRDIHNINGCVDVLFSICPEYIGAWKNQLSTNVAIDFFRLPLALAPYECIAHKSAKSKAAKRISILSVASFHPRKCHDVAIRAVKILRDRGIDCTLRIHSNLNQGEYNAVNLLGTATLGDAFVASNTEFSQTQLLELYDQSDIYLTASQGETCNIGLRNALAAGMPVVFTAIAGHRDLENLEFGVYPISNLLSVPAIYPERSGKTFGKQFRAEPEEIANSLALAIHNLDSDRSNAVKISHQIRYQDERRSKLYVWDLLAKNGLLATYSKLHSRKVYGRAEDAPLEVLVVPSLDAGFFSIFNTFVSHNFFWEYPSLYDKVIPIWSANAVKQATGKEVDQFTSYCYAKPDCENLFPVLFGDKPFYSSWSSENYKYTFARASANAWVDPNLTYIHSEKLYRSAIFQAWRAAMNEVFWDKFLIPGDVLLELNNFRSQIEAVDVLLSMHVRHASHAMEQKDKQIAQVTDYLNVARGWIASLMPTQSYGIILATDQEEVVREFESAFPGKVLYRKDVSRVSVENSKSERNIKGEEKLKEGRQIQHIMASNQVNWSEKNAVDVFVDAWILAFGDIFVHVNSNIATVVAIFNPNISMMHIKHADDFWSLSQRTEIISSIHAY